MLTIELVVPEDVHCALEHVAVDNGCALKLTVELIYSVSHDKVGFHDHAVHFFCTFSVLAPIFPQVVWCTANRWQSHHHHPPHLDIVQSL